MLIHLQGCNALGGVPGFLCRFMFGFFDSRMTARLK